MGNCLTKRRERKGKGIKQWWGPANSKSDKESRKERLGADFCTWQVHIQYLHSSHQMTMAYASSIPTLHAEAKPSKKQKKDYALPPQISPFLIPLGDFISFWLVWCFDQWVWFQVSKSTMCFTTVTNTQTITRDIPFSQLPNTTLFQIWLVLADYDPNFFFKSKDK